MVRSLRRWLEWRPNVKPGGAATNYDAHAEILRNAADRAKEHRLQITDWLVRESGSIRARAEFELDVTIKALHRASAMAAEATGELLPSFAATLCSISQASRMQKS